MTQPLPDPRSSLSHFTAQEVQHYDGRIPSLVPGYAVLHHGGAALLGQWLPDGARVLAVGDFNSSPFSPLFARFLQESGSRPATRYFTPTWKPFFLNIDHALAKGLNISARTLPWQHSDHRPLLVEYTGQ